MSKAERGAPRKTTTQKYEDAFTFGAAISLVSVAPLVVGSATLIYNWPPIPFNATLAVFVVVWIAALNRLQQSRNLEQDKAWRKIIHEHRSETQAALCQIQSSVDAIAKAVHDTNVTELAKHIDQHLPHPDLHQVHHIRGK